MAASRSVSEVRTRRGVAMTKITATTGSAKSQPRLWPSIARPPSNTAEKIRTPRQRGPVSRREPNTTHGQNAADQSAASAFAYPAGLAKRPSMK